MKDLVQVDDNNNNKIDLNLIKSGMINGSATTNGYALQNGLTETQCKCSKGEFNVGFII